MKPLTSKELHYLRLIRDHGQLGLGLGDLSVADLIARGFIEWDRSDYELQLSIWKPTLRGLLYINNSPLMRKIDYDLATAS